MDESNNLLKQRLENMRLGKLRKKTNWGRTGNLMYVKKEDTTDSSVVTPACEKRGESPLQRPKKRKLTSLIDNIIREDESGFEIASYPGKGKGIKATKAFAGGDFLLTYTGKLITEAEGTAINKEYEKDPTKGCFLVFFNFNGHHLCIDATEDDGHLCRWVNHSRRGNAALRCQSVQGDPVLYLIAIRDIQIGEEILYDYGDRDPEVIKANSWLLQ